MKVLLKSKSGKNLACYELSKRRMKVLMRFLQNLHDLDNMQDMQTCLVTLNSLAWTFDKKTMFNMLWRFIYEAYQLQSSINEVKKQTAKLQKVKVDKK